MATPYRELAHVDREPPPPPGRWRGRFANAEPEEPELLPLIGAARPRWADEADAPAPGLAPRLRLRWTLWAVWFAVWLYLCLFLLGSGCAPLWELFDRLGVARWL